MPEFYQIDIFYHELIAHCVVANSREWERSGAEELF